MKVSMANLKSRANLPTESMSLAEAREALNNEFGDMVSVHKAFQMLGQRSAISP